MDADEWPEAPEAAGLSKGEPHVGRRRAPGCALCVAKVTDGPWRLAEAATGLNQKKQKRGSKVYRHMCLMMPFEYQGIVL